MTYHYFNQLYHLLKSFSVDNLPSDNSYNQKVKKRPQYEYWATIKLPKNIIIDKDILKIYCYEYHDFMIYKNGDVDLKCRLKDEFALLIYDMIKDKI